MSGRGMVSLAIWGIALLGVLGFSLALSSCKTDTATGPGAAVQGTSNGSFVVMSQRDTDGDGIVDVVDKDDDNDGLDDDVDMDDDNDGVSDDQECDSDHDGVIDDHDDDYAELKGNITNITGNEIIVFNRLVLIGDETRIRGDEHATLTLGDLSVGMFVEVEGILNDDGSISALEIEVEHEDEDDHDSPPDSLVVQ